MGGGEQAEQLAEQAARAARVRELSTNPDVVALRVERVRVQVDRLAWAGIVLGLGFTMTNVHDFAAGNAAPWSATWVAAWALDPMVSLVLIAVLRAEQVTARWQVRPGPWVRRARWTTLVATYVMNSWSAWAAGDPALVVLHSVPPLVVFVAAEAVTGLREALTDAVHAAAGSSASQHLAAKAPTNGDYLDAGPATGSAASGDQLAEQPVNAVPMLDITSASSVDAFEAAAARSLAQSPQTTAEASTETRGETRLEAQPEGLDRQRPDPGEQPDGEELDERPPGDSRVRELVELLADGEPVTGAQAAALFGCSGRTGRRLLAIAQAASTDPASSVAEDSAQDSADAAPLHLLRVEGGSR